MILGSDSEFTCVKDLEEFGNIISLESQLVLLLAEQAMTLSNPILIVWSKEAWAQNEHEGMKLLEDRHTCRPYLPYLYRPRF